MKTRSKIITVLSLILVSVFLLSTGVLAQVSPRTVQPPPDPIPGSQPINLQRIVDATADIAQFLLFVGALVAVIFIVWGGIKWMSAGANPSKTAEARQTILNGLIGAIIILGVGTLLATAGYIFNAISTGTL